MKYTITVDVPEDILDSIEKEKLYYSLDNAPTVEGSLVAILVSALKERFSNNNLPGEIIERPLTTT